MFAEPHLSETLGRFELRPVEPGETIELLHMLRPMPARPPAGCDSGSARPLPRYLDASSEGQVAVVACMASGAMPLRTVGVGVIRPVDEDGAVAEVQVYVVPSVRQQGVGTSMFAALVELAAGRGVRRLRFRVPSETSDLSILLGRLSISPCVWDEGEQRVVEFPIAAGLGDVRSRRAETLESDTCD